MTNLRERGVAKKADRFQESLTALGPGSPNRRLRGRAHATASNLARTLCGFRKCGIKSPNIARNRVCKEGMRLLHVSFATLSLATTVFHVGPLTRVSARRNDSLERILRAP